MQLEEVATLGDIDDRSAKRDIAPFAHVADILLCGSRVDIALQGGKKCLCPRACVESSLKVLGDGRVAGGIIGFFPTSILLGTQHFLEPTVFHSSGFQQSRCLLAVDLRPDASLAPRSESLQPSAGVLRLLLCIDPSIAERRFQCLGVG